MAIKAFGTNWDVEGWALHTVVPHPSGKNELIFKGNSNKLSEMLSNIQNNKRLIFDELNISLDPNSGVATINVLRTANANSLPDNRFYRKPTCSIQGAMLSPQLHQSPYFKDLPIEAVTAVEYCMKQFGQVTNGDIHGLGDLAYLYACWKSYGINTFLAPSYTMTQTFFLKSKNDVTNYIRDAGKVFTFTTAVAKLPSSIRPPDINVPAWLAQAPSVQITDDGVSVTQVYVGAEKFPSFYVAEDEELLYDAPAIPDDYWRDSKFVQQTSGEE